MSTSINLRYTRRDRSGPISASESPRMAPQAGFGTFDFNGCDNPTPVTRGTKTTGSLGPGLSAAAPMRRASLLRKAICPFTTSVRRKPWPIGIGRKNSPRRTLETSGMLGVQWVVVHAGTASSCGQNDRRKKLYSNAEYLSGLAQRAAASGCRGIALDNVAHAAGGRTLAPMIRGTTDGLIELVDIIKFPHVGICWDFGHANLTRESQPDSLRRAGKRLKATHVQDNMGVSNEHTLPFRGNISREEAMPVLGEIAYEGGFTYEIQNNLKDMPPAPYLPALALAWETGEHLARLAEKP